MALNITKYRIILELTTDMLGTVPKNRDVFTSYIAEKARKIIAKGHEKGVPLTDGTPAEEDAVAARLGEEELTIDEVEEKGWTGFHIDSSDDQKRPFLYDYVLKGFLKSAATVLKSYDLDDDEQVEVASQSATKKKKPDETLKQLHDKVEKYVFILPRRIYLPVSGEMAALERPLRAMTAQGPRVTVVRSDTVPEGTKLSFDLHVLKGGGITEGLLTDLLEYGMYKGLGQWRSGGYGRFVVSEMAKK